MKHHLPSPCLIEIKYLENRLIIGTHLNFAVVRKMHYCNENCIRREDNAAYCSADVSIRDKKKSK